MAFSVVEVQGGLLRAHMHPRPLPPKGGGQRGVVRDFSPASRARMLRFLARLERSFLENSVFVTLTYPDPPPPPREAKEHLHRFCKRIIQHYRTAVVWKFEMESSGVRSYHPHFHLILLNISFIPYQEIQSIWEQVIGRPVPYGTRVEKPRGNVLRYIAKYVAKVEMGLSTSHICPGRFWGVYGRQYLVYSQYIAFCVPLKVFYDVRRLLRRYFVDFKHKRWYRLLLFGTSFCLVAGYDFADRLLRFVASVN